MQDVAGLEHLIGAINQVVGVARTRTTVVLSTKFEARVPGPSIDPDPA